MMTRTARSNKDLRDLPAYGYAEASRVVGIPAGTLRAWTRGQKGFEHVFKPAGARALSYFNLIEARVLRSIRGHELIPMKAVREAVEVASREFGIDRLLIHEDFRFGAGELFLERYSTLASLTPSRQFAIRSALDGFLRRVEYDLEGLPRTLYPVVGESDARRLVEVNPFVSFGRAVVAGTGISTQAVASRYNAGEKIPDIARDYDIEEVAVEEAIYFEAA
jgi:uncharacterized protein (DUF433 family)